MAWNEPGGSGGKDPWGQRKRDQGPPDLDQIVRNIQDKLRGAFGGRRGGAGGGGAGGAPGVGGFGVGIIALVIVGLWLLSGFYIVQQGERGVELRFGKKTVVTEAGLHWHMPFPIEKVEKVDVEAVNLFTIGYLINERTGVTSKVPREALMLTQDENIVDIEFSVQYRVKDAQEFLFNVNDPVKTIRQATESAVREMVGKSTFEFIITEGREEVAQKTEELLQEILDRYRAGIQVVGVKMQDATRPEEVKAAFDDAVKAREDEERLKNEAQAYANDVIPRARGAAARLIQEAEGYKASVIARADGEARRFSQIAVEYARAPGVTRDRLYIEAMEQVLSSTTKVLIDQKGGNNILYLPLDRIVSQSTGSSVGPVNTLTPLPESGDPLAAAARERARDSRTRGAP
ncbi:MAG TPA: FtsH protease activity modulator HflK [Acidiferrobacterales bacterium]